MARLTYAPLSYVATAYRRAGAEMHHIADDPDLTVWFDAHPPGPIADVLSSWLEHIGRVAVLHA